MDKLVIDTGGNVFGRPDVDLPVVEGWPYQEEDDRLTVPPPAPPPPQPEEPGVISDEPDPVLPVKPKDEWHDQPEGTKKPAQRSLWNNGLDYGEVIVKGVTEGAGQAALSSAKGALAQIDIMTDPSRKAEAMFLPTLRTIAEIKDAAEREQQWRVMREGVRYMLPDQRDRETVYRLIEDVKENPDFLPMAEKELANYAINSEAMSYLLKGSNALSEALKVSPEFQGGITHSLSQGFGSYVTMVAASLVGRGLGVASGITQAQGEALDRALAEGLDPSSALEAATLAIVPGMTDYVPIEHLLRIPQLSKTFGGFLKRVGTQAMIEGGQEGVQQLLQNSIAQYLYKPEQQLREEIAANFGIGAGVGALAEFTTHMLGLRRRFFSERQVKALDDGEAAPFEQALQGLVGPSGERGPADPGASPPSRQTAAVARPKPPAEPSKPTVFTPGQPSAPSAPAAAPVPAAIDQIKVPAPGTAPMAPRPAAGVQKIEIAKPVMTAERRAAQQEAYAQQRRLDEQTPIQLVTPEGVEPEMPTVARVPAKARLDKLRAEGAKIAHPELGDVVLTRDGVKKMMRGTADPAQIAVMNNLEQVFSASTPISEPTPQRQKPGKGERKATFVQTAARVNVDGAPVIAVFTTKRSEQGVTSIYNVTTLADVAEGEVAPAAPPSSGLKGPQGGEVARATEFVRKPAKRVKSVEAAKAELETSEIGVPLGDKSFTVFIAGTMVRDDDTGDPAVVYHMTLAETDFSIFRIAPDDIGVHLGTAGQANQRGLMLLGGRAKEPVNARVIPGFASIVNPVRLEDPGEWGPDTLRDQLLDLFPEDENEIYALQEPAEVREFLMGKGHDGVVYRNTGEIEGLWEARLKRDAALEAWTQAGQRLADETGQVANSRDPRLADFEKAYDEAHAETMRIREQGIRDSWIIFEPNQFKSAFAEAFDVTDMDMSKIEEDEKREDRKNIELYEREMGPLWVSGLARIVRAMKQEKAPVDQWVNTIRNAQGIRPAELEVTGLLDWLASHTSAPGSNKPPSITKDEIVKYIEAHQLNVEEVIRRDRPYVPPPPTPRAPRDRTGMDPWEIEPDADQYIEDAGSIDISWETDEPDENYLYDRASDYINENFEREFEDEIETARDEAFVEAMKDGMTDAVAIASEGKGIFDRAATPSYVDDEDLDIIEAEAWERYNKQQRLEQEEELPLGLEPLPEPQGLIDIAREIYLDWFDDNIDEKLKEELIDKQVEQEREWHYQDDEAPQSARIEWGGRTFHATRGYGETYLQSPTGRTITVHGDDDPAIEAAITEWMIDHGDMRSRENEEEDRRAEYEDEEQRRERWREEHSDDTPEELAEAWADELERREEWEEEHDMEFPADTGAVPLPAPAPEVTAAPVPPRPSPDDLVMQVARSTKWATYRPLTGGEQYTELTITVPTVEWSHGHWPEGGVVGHVRFVRTTDAEGKQVLLLLELQSDIHQAGHKRGYQQKDHDERMRVLARKVSDADAEVLEARKAVDARLGYDISADDRHSQMSAAAELEAKTIVEALSDREVLERVEAEGRNTREGITTLRYAMVTREYDRLYMLKRAEREAAIKADARLNAAQDEYNRLRAEEAALGEAVADAPFKSTWEELILARMIRWAAERDFDHVAWAPGEYQNEVWTQTMRQYVQSIQWSTYSDGDDTILGVQARGSRGSPHFNFRNGKLETNDKDWQGASIADVFGDKVAKQIAESEAGTGKLEGDAIGIGTRGFTESYDKILVNEANKLIKKWKSKVGVIKVPKMEMPSGSISWRMQKLKKEQDTQQPTIPEGYLVPEVWAFPITPQMREAALGGMDLSYMTGFNPAAEEARKPYPGERTRPKKGVPDRQGARAVSPRTIVGDFTKALNLILRRGIEGQKKSVRGIYKWKTGVARVRDTSDMTDVFHEGGHALHDKHPGLDAFTRRFAADLASVAQQYYPAASQLNDAKAQRREGFATLFHLYMNNPKKIETTHPAVYQAFDEWLKRMMPREHAALQQVRRDVDDYMVMPSRMLTADQIVSGRKETAMQAVRRAYRDGTVLENFAALANRVYTATMDDKHPITVAIRKLKRIGEDNLRIAMREAGMSKAAVKAELAKYDLRGANNPVHMAQLARNGYVQGQDWVMNGPTRFGTADTRVAPSLSEVYVDLFQGRTKFISRKEETQVKNDFDLYLVHRRALEETRNFEATKAWIDGGRQGAGPPVKRYKSPIGQLAGEIVSTLKSLEAQYPHFRSAAVKYYKFMNAVLQYKYDAGQMTKAEYEGALRIKNYAPVRRKMDDKATGAQTGRASKQSGRDNLVRGFRGSTRDIISPLETAAQIAYETAALVRGNQIKVALANVAALAGVDSGSVIEEIPAQQVQAITAKLLDLVKAGQSQLNVSDELDDLLDADGTTLIDFLEEFIPDTATATMWSRALRTENNKPIMFIREQGKVRAFLVNDEGPLTGLYEALTVGPVQIPPDLFEAVLTKGTAVFRAGVTTHPPYAIANIIRDTVQYAVFYPGFIPGWTTAKGIYHVIAQDKVARAFAQANGMVGGANAAALDTVRVERELSALRKRGFIMRHFASWRDVAKLIEVAETGSRVGLFGIAYRRALRDGLNTYDAASEAAFTAQDVLNFSRNGSYMIRARRFATFLMVNLTGLDKQARVLLGAEGSLALWRKQVQPLLTRDQRLPMTRGEKKELGRALYAWGAMTTLALVSALRALEYWDDEEYAEFSPYLKATRWMEKVGDTWYAIPKPYTLAIVANAVEAAIDEWGKNDPTGFARFREGLLHTTVPPFENPVLKTFYEQAANRNTFTDRSIVTDTARPEFMQYDAYTSELSKLLGRLTAEATGTEGLSPQRLDHIITGLGASWGRALLRGSDYLRPDAPERVLADNPFTSYFIKDWKRGANSATAFYQAVSQANGEWTGLYASYKSLMDGGSQSRAADLLSMYDANARNYAVLNYHFDTKEKRLHPMRRAETVVGSINEMTKEMLTGNIRLDKGKGEELVMSPSVKRAALETLSALRLREMRNALVVLGVEGWGQKKVLTTSLLIEQLREIQPEMAEELELRIGDRAYSFDRVRELWPRVKAALEKDQGQAKLLPMAIKAIAGGRKYWTEGDAP